MENWYSAVPGVRSCALLPELQRIVFAYAGALEDPDNRQHRFLTLEMKILQMLGRVPPMCLRPSWVRLIYTSLGRYRITTLLRKAYLDHVECGECFPRGTPAPRPARTTAGWGGEVSEENVFYLYPGDRSDPRRRTRS